MNTFSEEQAAILMNHVKFMLDTNKFNFVIYFPRQYDIGESNIARISSYSIRPSSALFDKYIRFNTFNQVEDYINNCFESVTDFFNNFFVFHNEQIDYLNNTDPFVKSFNYIQDHFRNKLSSEFQSNLYNWSKQQHIAFFNFVYAINNENVQNEIEIINGRSFDSSCKFFNNNLTDAEKTFFTNAYKFNLYFNNNESSVQIEQDLSTALMHYRLDFYDFNTVYNTIQNYEYCVKNYLLERIKEFNLIMHGKNNMYTNALKDCVNKMIKHFSSKKIQFAICNDKTNEQFKIEYISDRIQNDDEQTKSILLKLMPEKTSKMLNTTFACRITCKFNTPITMQVKKTFMHNLNNYFINNNIKPITYRLIDEGKSKPAEGFSMSFKCSDFERIGVNPIKFMIPKLGMMKKLG